jgi:hypothetical protein
MHEKMPEKSREFIESECLKVARLQLGCNELQTVRIGRTKPRGSGPNWEGFQAHIARDRARCGDHSNCGLEAKIRTRGQLI